MTVRILTGDCRKLLRSLPDESVHCCISSPPYFGLRDYGVADQIGLEPTPEAYVVELVLVFREVRRVLRNDGTVWLNLGDSYAGSGRGGNPTEESSTLQGSQASQRASMVKRTRKPDEVGSTQRAAAVPNVGRRATRGSQIAAGLHETARQAGALGRAWVPPPSGLKQKDLIGIPWMVAFALRADGWWLRQDIVWSKPNPMPESVTDRCTKSHEYVFLLSKSGAPTIWRARDTGEWSTKPDLSERLPAPTEDEPGTTVARWRGHDYYFNQDAILEPISAASAARFDQPNLENQHGSERAHAGCKTNGNMKAVRRSGNKARKFGEDRGRPGSHLGASVPWQGTLRNKRSVWTVATKPFKEAHFATFPPELIEPCIKAGSPTGGVILDPFGGAGTTGLVAARLKRDAVLIEINPSYADMARRRISGDAPLLGEVARPTTMPPTCGRSTAQMRR